MVYNWTKNRQTCLLCDLPTDTVHPLCSDCERELPWLGPHCTVCALPLPAAGLVTMHSGNASGLDRRSGHLLIKPSGVDYDTLRPDDLGYLAWASARLASDRSAIPARQVCRASAMTRA